MGHRSLLQSCALNNYRSRSSNSSLIIMSSDSLLIRNAIQILQVCDEGQTFLAGEAAGKLAQLDAKPNTGLSLVIKAGLIEDFGTDSEIAERHDVAGFDDVIDAGGKCVVPGLIDG